MPKLSWITAAALASGLWTLPANATLYSTEVTVDVGLPHPTFTSPELHPGDQWAISILGIEPTLFPRTVFGMQFFLVSGPKLIGMGGALDFLFNPYPAYPNVPQNVLRAADRYGYAISNIYTYEGPAFANDGVVLGGQVFSQGIPEPRTWAMMLLGLAGLGTMTAWSKRKPQRSRHGQPSALTT